MDNISNWFNDYLALHPGQARVSPSTQCAAMTIRVALAFETFEHVIGLGIAGLRGHERRFM